MYELIKADEMTYILVECEEFDDLITFLGESAFS